MRKRKVLPTDVAMAMARYMINNGVEVSLTPGPEEGQVIVTTSSTRFDRSVFDKALEVAREIYG